ncbi:MAG: DctP family TRAP transporter solute-binding subunit [Firmicutes bacterium]|nr:DctP family TRAP transporter solute-binding subunit [Bacillota bacterium]
MKRKPGMSSMIALALATMLLLGTTTATAQTYNLRVSHVVAQEHPYHYGALEFERLIEERTGGRIQVTVFSDGQLGAGEREQVEALQLGAIDIVITGTAVLANWVPRLAVMDLPFIFRDYDHVDAVLDGPVGQRLLQMIEDARIGIKPLALWEQGFRHLTNSRRPIHSPADVRGLKIRVQENPIHVASFETMDASATPMSWGEVYTALQQGVIDGQENPVPVLLSHRIYEVNQHLAMTGHFYAPAIIIMNEARFRSMPEDLQQALVDVAREVSRYEREVARRMEQEQLDELVRLGMNVTTPDKRAFQETMTPVYDRFRDQLGADLIQAVIDAGQ